MHIHGFPRENPCMNTFFVIVLVVVGTPIVAIQCAAGPRILGPAHNGGVLIENGCLLCERHPIQIIQKTLQLHITQKIVL